MATDDLWWLPMTNYHLVDHIGWQPLQEITKMTSITHRVNTEIWNKNQTLLSVGKASNSTWWQPLQEITKMALITCIVNIETWNKKNTTKFGSIFNFNMMLAILDAWTFEIFDNFWNFCKVQKGHHATRHECWSNFHHESPARNSCTSLYFHTLSVSKFDTTKLHTVKALQGHG